MKTIKIKRLWNNLASVRDYMVKEAIEKNEDIQLVLGDRTMTLTPQQLRTKSFQMVSESFGSKYVSGMNYRLIDFTWRPDEKNKTIPLFN